MRLIFVWGRQLSHPQKGEDRARGGISTALLALSRTLAARGHEVHLVAHMTEDGDIGGVGFHDRSQLASLAASGPVDALVVIPELLPVLLPIAARVRVAWSGNSWALGDCALSAPWTWAPSIGKKGATARLWTMPLLHPFFDRVVAVGRWQADLFVGSHGVPLSKIRIAYNGVPLEHYANAVPRTHPHRVVYSSLPHRGLDVLLRLFPAVRAEVPDAELHVFSYEGGEPPAQAGSPGVVWRGAVIKSVLARELQTAGLMAYPCTFEETFCTAVAEAQAAGLPVVARAFAALPERIADGIDGYLVHGEPGTRGFDEAFVAAVVRLLTDDALRARLGAASTERAQREYDWESIAEGWERDLEALATGETTLPVPIDTVAFFGPDALRQSALGASAEVPGDVAARWLVNAWESYGFDRRDLGPLPSTPTRSRP
jgi:glycosyltransferase involved in cell wall biosynthesis